MAYPSPRRLQLRRGNAAAIASYLGYAGELVVDTSAWTLYVHDGVTVGGYAATVNTASISGNINSILNGTAVFGNIIPSANAVYSLGNITHQWKSLFVSNSTIYVGGVPLSIDTTGNLTVNGNIIPTIAYVNASVANVTVDLSAYALNANVTAANVGLKGYVDQANTIQSSQLTSANLGIIGYVDLANTIQSAQISAANIGIIGYIDQANTIQSAQVNAANLAITAANLGLKGYVDQANTIQSAQLAAANVGIIGYIDSQSFYSNVKVATYLQSGNIANVSVAGNVTATYFVGNGALLTGIAASSNYSNIQVATYLPTYDGNIAANISKAGYTWTFGTGGTTQFPNSLILAPAGQSITMQSDNYSQLMWENANLTVAPNMAINSNFYVTQNNATLDIGYRDGNSTQLIKSWYWNVDGNLKLPSGGYILNSDDSIYGGGDYSNVQVETYLAGTITTGNINVGNTGSALSQVTIYGKSSATLGMYNSSGDVGAQIYLGDTNFNSSTKWNSAPGIGATYDSSYAGGAYGLGLYTYDGADNSRTLRVTIKAGSYAPSGGEVIIFSNSLSTSTTSGALQVYGGVGVGGNLNVGGNVTANTGSYFVGNGAFLTGIIAGSSYSNVQVATYLPTYSGVVTASNVAVAGNVTAQYLFGNGSQLTGIASSYSNVQTAAYLNATGYNLYSNVNVAAYLSTATINTTGNITAGNLITGGALYVANITTTGASGNISGANYITANVILTNGGWGNISQVANIQANAVLVSGNITATYFLGNGALLTGIVAGSSYSNVQVATYLPTYAGTVSASLVNSSGNILSTGLSVFGNTRIGSLATPGAEHTIIGNVSVSGAGTEYFNIGGNIMAIQASFGSINTTGNITAQNLIGNISITGNVTGTSANVTLQAGAYTSVFDNQGNVILPNVYVSGNITVGNIAGKTNGFTLGYLEMPQVASGNVTLALSDSGKHFYNTTASPQTITIPTFANVAFGNGTVVSIANQSTSNISVALQSGVILYLAGNATSASRTITSYGVATLLKVNTNTWFINGSGVA